MVILQVLTLYGLFISTTAFFFGNSGCGCAPRPVCPQTASCAHPPPSPCGQAAERCGGGDSYQQAPPIIPPPSYSVGAPSYLHPIFPQSPIYQPSQASQLPMLQNDNNVGLPIGALQQIPVQSYGQEAQRAGIQRGVEQQKQQEEYKLQRDSASAAGQKIEEVIEEEGDVKEKAGNESTETQRDTNTTEATEELRDFANLKLTNDSLCNSEELRKLVLDNIDDNINNSKRLIQLNAEAHFGGRFDVICANGDFSYVTNTELYCQETKGEISCYTYRQL